MESKSQSIATKATQQAVDPASLCGIMEHSTVSVQSSALGSFRCGMRTGEVRINAPLPADFEPAVCHGLPDLRFARNSRTASLHEYAQLIDADLARPPVACGKCRALAPPFLPSAPEARRIRKTRFTKKTASCVTSICYVVPWFSRLPAFERQLARRK
jgi:hypothetical protein